MDYGFIGEWSNVVESTCDLLGVLECRVSDNMSYTPEIREQRCACRPGERRMALIEHLEREGWEEFLRDMFRYTLDVLENDRFRAVGSSVDDLRSWLARGGVARVRERLDAQMDARRFPPSRRAAVNDCIEQLVRETRDTLFDLTAKGIIPATGQEWLDAREVSETDVRDILDRILAGERPFEDWMYEHGHSDEEIAEIYTVIDNWLVRNGIISKPGPLPRRGRRYGPGGR